MNRRQELIAKALRQRLASLVANVQTINAEDFGESAGFVNCACETIMQRAHQDSSPLEQHSVWMSSDADCLTSLRQLALGKRIRTFQSPPPTDNLLESLLRAKSEPKQRFHLLADHFRNPLNFVLPTELQTREYVLERLMVQDRAQIERQSVSVVDSDDLLLKLNFIAVYAICGSDLRFLDALNYYYELLPSRWHPNGQYPWLLISYLALYARALNSPLKDD